jgi:hypothetical protein
VPGSPSKGLPNKGKFAVFSFFLFVVDLLLQRPFANAAQIMQFWIFGSHVGGLDKVVFGFRKKERGGETIRLLQYPVVGFFN